MMHNLSAVYFVKHLYMFRAYLQPIIKKSTVWVQQLVLPFLFRWLSLILAGIRDSHLKRTIIINCCIHTVYLLIMGCRYSRNM